MKAQSDRMKIKTGETFRRTLLIHLALSVMFVAGLGAETTVYDLRAFLDRVETHNRDLKLAAKELDMAEVHKKEALSTALPKVMVEGSYARNLKDIFLFIDFPDFETGEMTNQKFKINYKNEFGLSAVLNQTIFSFQVGTALRASKQYERLTGHVYNATRLTIIKFAKKAFYQTLLLKAVWELSRSSEENARENYLQMKMKYDHGQISQFSLLQAEVRWQNQIPLTTQAQRNFELARNSLKDFAVIPDEEEIELRGDFNNIPPMPLREDLAPVLERRPDFNALLWEEKLRGTAIKSEKANQLPNLSLNLIYNFSSLSDEFSFERQNNAYIVGLNLSVPIYTGGYTQAQVQKARIDLEKTQLEIQKERDSISNELINIHLRLEEANKRIEAAKKSLETARKAWEIAEVTAANGLATQLELKDARIAYDQATLNSYSAIYDYLAAYFDWQLASGRPGAGN